MTSVFGKIGLWTSVLQWPTDLEISAQAGVEIEELGFSTLWIGGREGQTPIIDAILGATSRLIVATGITQIWINPASQVAEDYHKLNTDHQGRFVLGLGVGHAPVVEASGHKYERPLSKLNSYLDELDTAEHPVPVSGRIIAALRPKALGIAGARSAGAHPYNTTPEHTARARALLGPSPLLIPEQAIVITNDAATSREWGRAQISKSLTMENYLNSFRDLGFDDRDFADGGSDKLIDALVGWGSPIAIAARVQEHLDAGANQVAVQVLNADGFDALPRTEWRQAAEILLR
jgi:probable F420-dependent oxidoreductase